MTKNGAPDGIGGSAFEPAWPTAMAVVLFALWILLLSAPMWSGQFLAGPWSDQYATGYAYRHWQAVQWKALGHIPLWNPTIFGGLPYVGAMHGDIFYPTAWLRLVLPTALAMDLGFVIHYVLAALFTYLLLRKLGASWGGAVVGGFSYQLSGVIGSYVQPGHDGKLFVTTLLPLALLSLWVAIRDRRLEGYALLAVTVGLSLLSPQTQMTQYLLIAAGLFTLYLVFGEPKRAPVSQQATELAMALGAVVLGFMISAVQFLPFWEYIPFSPRAESYGGYEAATSFAIPWEHVPEFFLSRFVGDSGSGTYWGTNGLKLHSEYLGMPVLALAVLGAAGTKHRRLIVWLGGIGLLFLLVSLGGATPFYKLWYAVVPGVKQTRAPGMALYVVALVVSTFAAFGVGRLESGEGKHHAVAWLSVGTAVVLLAVTGAWGGFAAFLAQGIQQARGIPAAQIVGAARAPIMIGALGSGVALMLVGGLSMGALEGKLKPALLALGLALLVSGDLYRNARGFWVFSKAQSELHGSDPVVEQILLTPKPYRVLNLADPSFGLGGNDYPGATLMSHDISQLLGHHGVEIHRFDELMGGKNRWQNLGSMNLWDMYAVEHVIVPGGADLFQNALGFTARFQRSLTGATTAAGGTVDLYTRIERVPYARLVPGAIKSADEEAIATVIDPRFEPDRLVLLDPEATVEPEPLSEMPEALGTAVRFESWEPGRMEISLDPPAPQRSYLVVAENWYPDWKATVDGIAAQVLRADVAMLAVSVPEGARQVELVFDSSDYRLGRAITWIALLLAATGVIAPPLLRKRKATGG